jgi:hypothetical protein
MRETSRIEAMQARTMLTPGITAAYRKNVERQGNACSSRLRCRVIGCYNKYDYHM